jgi:hypothetical protein
MKFPASSIGVHRGNLRTTDPASRACDIMAAEFAMPPGRVCVAERAKNVDLK